MAKKHEIDMTTGNLFGKMIVFTIPIILSGILQLLYNAADIVVVGRFAGKEALAAVGSTGPLINLMLNLFMGLSVGSNIVLATAYGEGNAKKISDIVHTSVTMSIICGIILGILGFFASKPLLVIMNTPYDTIDLCSIYLKIIFLGMPAHLVYNFGAAMLRAIGDTKRPLYILLVTGVVNVVLNLILVIFFNMSVAGVGIATIVSQYLSAIYIIRCFVKSEEKYKLDLKNLKINKKVLMKILAFGIPGGIQSTVFSLSNSIIQSAVNGFGSVAVAGNSIANNIEGFIYTALNSVTQAATSFTGQNLGAGKLDRIKKTFWYSCLIVITIGVVMSGGAIIFATPLSMIYSTVPEVIDYSVLRLCLLCPAYILCGLMDVTVGSLRGMGKSVTSMLSCILGVCGIRIVWVFTIFKAFPTFTVLYFSYPVSWAGTATILIIAFFVSFNKLKKQIQ